MPAIKILVKAGANGQRHRCSMVDVGICALVDISGIRSDQKRHRKFLERASHEHYAITTSLDILCVHE